VSPVLVDRDCATAAIIVSLFKGICLGRNSTVGLGVWGAAGD
jgi:hypothetical protein